MRLRFVLALLAGMLLLGEKAMSQYRFLGNLTGIDFQKDGALLRCGDDLVRLTLLAPDLARITLAPEGRWHSGPDYAIARAEWPGATFTVAENATHVMLKTTALEIRILRSPCRLAFYDAGGNLLNQDEEAFGLGWEGKEVAVFKSLLAGERFYGLGEKTGGLDRRGSEWQMWNSDIPAYSDRTDPLYQSHPFFIGMRAGRGYGIFFNNTHRSFFNMGAGNHRVYSFRAEGGALDYFFFAGNTMKDIIRRYSELVGRMPLPPKWALGYQQCRWSYFPESEVRQLARTFREKKIPADVIYLDIHHMDGYRCFTFDAQRFPDPAGLLADLRQQGFKVVTISDPGIKVDPGYAVYESGLQGDHFIKFPDGQPYIGDVWPGPSHFTNYTKPESRAWWGDLHKDFLDKGIAGFWNDMNEPAVWGREAPLLVEFDENGRKVSIKKIHNVFGHLMAQATYEGLRRLRPQERPFILTRAGFAGTQRWAASWTGDNVASFEHLEVAIRMCQSMSVSGIPFVGADVGGFAETPTTELFVRWMQVGAFTPFFRTHTHINSPDQEPWSFGEWAEEVNRKYIELRYRLLPYTYTAFHQAAVEGVPIMRPLFLEFPEEAETYQGHNHTTYLWGNDMLVAPVTRAGERIRKVYLPAGTWYDFWENKTYAGGNYIYVDAPVEKLPLFVRAGAVLPMGEVLQYVEEKPLTQIDLHVYPGAERTSVLYEDDGRSFEYADGMMSLTSFKVTTKAKNVTFSLAGRQGKYAPPARDYRIILHGQSNAPKLASLDAGKVAAADLSFEAGAGTVTVRLRDDGKAHTLRFDF
ncbi:MAG: Oligosaccharide 4-alpha-D-glucosyltransferase [bacterium]|nr:Oligosaccharide 4-alpha-D-glucosyltransferase [bacterium]